MKRFLIFPAATFDFAVVARCIRANQLVPDVQDSGRGLKQDLPILVAAQEAVHKLESVVHLDTVDAHPFLGKSVHELLQKTGEGIYTLFRMGAQKAQSRILVDGGVFEIGKAANR